MVKICNISDKITYRELEVYLTNTFTVLYRYEDSVEWVDLRNPFMSAVGSYLRNKYEDKEFTDENIVAFTMDFKEYLDMEQTERQMFVNYVILMLDNIIKNKLDKVHMLIKRIEGVKEGSNSGEVQR